MYIRTKDGIHSVEVVTLSNGRIRYSLSNEDSLISKEDFEKITIREADTIEELCDEFVGVDNTCENGHQLLRAIPYKCANFWNGGVYGAIWVDGKGLIYVAKMNENGEWELI